MIKYTCPKCGGRLVLLISINKKLCADCKVYHDWNLEKGQAPIFK